MGYRYIPEDMIRHSDFYGWYRKLPADTRRSIRQKVDIFIKENPDYRLPLLLGPGYLMMHWLMADLYTSLAIYLVRRQEGADRELLLKQIDRCLTKAGRKLNSKMKILMKIPGGPGAPELVFAYLVEAFERRYTIVYYDQRGAGKTLKKNPFAKVSMELLLQDLVETVSYLKHVYNKKKIMILGHSWGSVLGSAYALAHPENVSCYIGCGQMYCFRENEKRAYSFLKTAIRKNRNRSAWNQLKRIGPYPPDRCSLKALMQVTRIRALQGKLGLAMAMNLKAVQLILRSPVCGLTDVIAFVLGSMRSAVMMREFWNYDLQRKGDVYRMPVFYVMGDRDRMTPHEIARDFFDRMEAPYKEWCFVPDAGHFAMLDNTESWQRILNEVVIKDINSNRTVSGNLTANVTISRGLFPC